MWEGHKSLAGGAEDRLICYLGIHIHEKLKMSVY